jgi:16S rRNA (uracil1498-N3)-methyltransferase
LATGGGGGGGGGEIEPMAERFYCPDARAEGRLALEGDEARHLSRVRRVGVGAIVEVFDGLGYATRAEVVGLGRERIELQPVGSPLPDRPPLSQVTLATAVPKGERFDWLVEKATELGVARLVPIVTRRSVVDPRDAKLDRLRRTIVEAAKQCGRNRLMALEKPTTWADLLRDADPRSLRLMAHPEGCPFASWPKTGRGAPTVVAVGPEGGFTDEEIAAARAGGWMMAGLGATLLRIETAGLVACARVIALAETSGDEQEGTDG